MKTAIKCYRCGRKLGSSAEYAAHVEPFTHECREVVGDVHPGDDEILPGSPRCSFCEGVGCGACGFTGRACPGCRWNKLGAWKKCVLQPKQEGYHE